MKTDNSRFIRMFVAPNNSIFIFLLGLLIFETTTSAASEQVDSIRQSYVVKGQQVNFHRVLLSVGTINRFDKRISGSSFAEIHVQLLKNLFVGFRLSIERVEIDCSTNAYTSIVDCTDLGVSVMYMSSPVWAYKNFTFGGWGQISYQRLCGDPSHIYESEEVAYHADKYCLNKDYLRGDIGIYLKWKKLYFSMAYSIGNIDMKPYGSGRRSGLFRKPTFNGLSLMLRFGI